MVVIDHHTVLKTEPSIVTGELRFWGNKRENVEDNFVRKLENWENGMGEVNVRSKALKGELVLRLVWGAGAWSMNGYRFVRRPPTILVTNVEDLSRQRPTNP